MVNKILLKQKRGAILIISLWIAAILTVFCLSIAYRVNVGLKLTKLYRDRLKAEAICEGALFRVIQEKIEDENPEVDYFSELWSSKIDVDEETGEEKPFFKGFPLGEGNFTISYDYRESTDIIEPVTFYGMQDEQSKFNINKIVDRENQFIVLLNEVKGSYSPDLIAELKDWMSEHNNTINSLEELELIEGFNKELLYTRDGDEDGIIASHEIGLLEYITIYGDEESKINVNTASREVLLALGFDGDHVDYIIEERFGDDEFEIEDDGISDIADLEERLKTEFPGSIPDSAIYDYLDVKSLIYRVKIEAQVRNVKKKLDVVLNIPGGDYNILYWYEN